MRATETQQLTQAVCFEIEIFFQLCLTKQIKTQLVLRGAQQCVIIVLTADDSSLRFEESATFLERELQVNSLIH